MAHINLTRDADAVLVAPASADFVAKLLHGRADDLLSLLCLARPIERCPLLVAPAMNREMWAHPATQRNFAQLAADGADRPRPGSGDQACGEIGDGTHARARGAARRDDRVLPAEAARRPARPRHRRADVRADRSGARPDQPLERQDGLRDRARGRRGGRRRDARRRPGALATPRRVRRIDVTTALEMHAAVLAAVAQSDVFVATAAVADWRVAAVAGDKIKKVGRAAACRPSSWSRTPTSWQRRRAAERRRSASASLPRAAT